MEPDFGNLAPSGQAIKKPFWNHWEMAVFAIGKWPFLTKSWPGAFWSQILTIWQLLGRQLKRPFGTIGKRTFLAKYWPGAFLSQIFGNLAASGQAIKKSFETVGKWPFFAIICRKSARRCGAKHIFTSKM